MAEWCGARVLAGVLEAGGVPPRKSVKMRASRATNVIGYDVSVADATDVFGRLMMPAVAKDDEVTVEIPGYRVDIEREVDLIEEVVRVQGYDRVGSTLPAVRQPGGLPAVVRVPSPHPGLLDASGPAGGVVRSRSHPMPTSH